VSVHVTVAVVCPVIDVVGVPGVPAGGEITTTVTVDEYAEYVVPSTAATLKS